MEPEEKARQLVEAMTFKCFECDYEWVAKQCAITAVIELIIQGHPFGSKDYTDYIKNGQSYWHEVKKEIEKL